MLAMAETLASSSRVRTPSRRPPQTTRHLIGSIVPTSTGYAGAVILRVATVGTREPDTTGRSLRQCFRRRVRAVLAHDPRPPGAGDLLQPDALLDRSLVRPERGAMVEGLGVCRSPRGAHRTEGVPPDTAVANDFVMTTRLALTRPESTRRGHWRSLGELQEPAPLCTSVLPNVTAGSRSERGGLGLG